MNFKIASFCLVSMLIVLIGLIYWGWDSDPKIISDNKSRHSAAFKSTLQSILDQESVANRDHGLGLLVIENSGLSVQGTIEIIDAIEDDRLKLLVLREVLLSKHSDHNAYEIGVSYGIDESEVDILRNGLRKKIE